MAKHNYRQALIDQMGVPVEQSVIAAGPVDTAGPSPTSRLSILLVGGRWSGYANHALATVFARQQANQTSRC